MAIRFNQRGSFNNVNNFLKRMQNQEYASILHQYGKLGVDALSSATPRDTGKTASSWRYEIKTTKTNLRITWYNDNKAPDGTPIAILIQYGHGTGTGGYVQGRDFINPALQPIFDNLAESVWKDVTK